MAFLVRFAIKECFRVGDEQFFARPRKPRDDAEAYIGTLHKSARRLTPGLRKRAVSRRKLDEPTFLGVERQIDPIVDPDLAVNIVDMNLDRPFAHNQLLGNLIIT